MWKKLMFGLVVASFFLCELPQCKASIILSWNTSGNLGTETTEASFTNDPNIAAANLTLGAGITAAGNVNRFGGNSWFDTGNSASSTLAEAVAGNNFIQFVVTPTSGSFSATSFEFIWDRSSTGPSAVALRSSIDGFANDLGSLTGLSGSTTQVNTIAISGVNNISTATTFRLYGFNASALAGTGGFDTVASAANANVILNGTITAVPEPTSVALVSLAGCLGLVATYRRRLAKAAKV